MAVPQFNFAAALLQWFDEHGRKNLPWQHPIEPYRVWLSEVMLQQTQVETVIPYFQRFVAKFPTVAALAAAPLDEVLQLWTGLGYYARARNLHKCARQVAAHYSGAFPDNVEQLSTLPGIGKSTACAVASIAFGKPTAILDGNVKRVLARFHAVAGWPGAPKVEKQLWQHAERHMPKTRCADYTQAIMDLGATLCRRSSPDCSRCPVRAHCVAHREARVADFPVKKPRKVQPVKSTVMLILQDTEQSLLLEQRPPQGIWGGLWSFPEFGDEKEARRYSGRFGEIEQQETWAVVTHVFSHYKLLITPLCITLRRTHAIADHGPQWVKLPETLNLGLAAPVKRLIENVRQIAESLI